MFWHQINAYEINGMCSYNIILALIMIEGNAIFLSHLFFFRFFIYFILNVFCPVSQALQ